MGTDLAYWQAIIELIASTPVVLDRPRGTTHPRYADLIYPLDYSHLEKTSTGDGDGIDVWIGSSYEKTLTGILCTFDKLKRDAEMKLLIGCTKEDIETDRGFNTDMPTLYIPNPMVENDLSD